jgi:hypothetical protein
MKVPIVEVPTKCAMERLYEEWAIDGCTTTSTVPESNRETEMDEDLRPSVSRNQ